MRLGVFTPLLSQLPLEEVLAKLKAVEINTVELGTGNYPGNAHCKLSMLEDARRLEEFKRKLDDHGASISALSCHGNPLHPDPAQAKQAQEVNRKTILLAEKLGVPVVVDFSGCPGDSPNAKAPNWVTCPWPPEYLDVLAWQWDKVVAPYWVERAKFAADHGVRIAIEMHPGFVVYSPETMLGCAPSPARRSAATTIPATCSGRASIRSRPCAFWATRSFMFMQRTRSSTRRTCRAQACWTQSLTQMSGIAAGSSAPAATVTAPSGGRSSSPR